MNAVGLAAEIAAQELTQNTSCNDITAAVALKVETIGTCKLVCAEMVDEWLDWLLLEIDLPDVDCAVWQVAWQCAGR